MKYCNRCNTMKDKAEFERNRATCKCCRKEQAKERKKQQYEKDPVMYTCKRMAYDAHSRVFAKSRAHKRCYQNLEQPFGFSNPAELKLFLYEKFYDRIKWYLDRDITPSIDRIDSSIGYTRNNIQIIPFKQNTERGVDSRRRKVEMITCTGDKFIFNSVMECARYFGINKSSHTNKVSSWIKGDGKYTPPKGYKFRYLN